MAQFITIGYGNQVGYDRTEKSVRDAAHAADAERVRRGDQVGIAGEPVQVRNHDGTKVEITEGAFLSAGLPIAGFALFEASDMSAAIEIAANSPCAVAQGVVEVWPLNPPPESKT